MIPLGTLAGFALGRFQYRRPDNFNLTMWFLSQRFLPPAVVIIPYLLMMRSACGPIALPFGLWLPQPLQLVCVLEGGPHAAQHALGDHRSPTSPSTCRS